MEFSNTGIGIQTRISAFILALSMASTVSMPSQAKANSPYFWSPEVPGAQITLEHERNPSEQEFQLFHVTSDALDGALDIKAILSDQRELLGLSYLSDQGKRLSYNLEEIAQGADLLKDDTRSIVKVLGHQMSPGAGGALELIYLENGVTESYGSFNMFVARAGDNWEMRSPTSERSRKFTRMFLKGRRFFGKLIGIAEVSVN
jgi:hypothetical protein